MKLSVLMSVYDKENPDHFDQSLGSIDTQTYKFDEFVLIKDGPLNDSLEEIIKKWKQRWGNLVVVGLKKNAGLTNALNVGLSVCKYNLVARMDSDDLSAPDRFELQIEFFKKNPDVSIVGTWYKEFDHSPDNFVSQRELPQTHEQIKRFLSKRSPFHHSSVMYKRKDILGLGGYNNKLRIIQDYELWSRLVVKGLKTANIPKYLLYVRGGSELMQKRQGWGYLKNELLALRLINEIGLFSRFIYYRNVIVRSVIRMLPVFLVKMVYRYGLRKKAK